MLGGNLGGGKLLPRQNPKVNRNAFAGQATSVPQVVRRFSGRQLLARGFASVGCRLSFCIIVGRALNAPTKAAARADCF